MKQFQLALVTACAVLALSLAAVTANAASFKIEVSDINGVWGSGIVTASALGGGNYLATGGSLQLTGGPYHPFSGSLVPNPNSDGSPWVAVVYGGTDYIGLDDIIMQTGPNTFGLSANGILFNDTSFSTGGGNGLVIALWDNNPAVSGNAGAIFSGYNYSPYADVRSDLTVTVTNLPDGGTTVGLLGLGLVGCVLVSRKLKLA